MSHYEFTRDAFDGLSLYFQGWQADKDQKGVICLVHGLGEHSGRYYQWAEWLNQAGYSVLSYDLRGHGKSDGLRGHISSFEDHLKDTELLLLEARQRYPDMACFLYGHSLGAIIVAAYVLHRKPRLNGVILAALSVKTALQEQKGKILLAKLVGSIYPKFIMDSGLDPATISKDPEIVTRYKNDPLVHHQITAGFGKSSISEISWIDQHNREWTLPLLVMHGELDQLGYAEGSREFASRIKGDCTLKIWPGLVHEIHNEPEKAQVFEFLRQWLDKHANIIT
jgi:acylglycerol lipase